MRYFILLMLLFVQVVYGQQSFELKFGDNNSYEYINYSIELDGVFYVFGSKKTPDSKEGLSSKISISKISFDGEIVETVLYSKEDTSANLKFGIPKDNLNILCFGNFSNEPTIQYSTGTYVCEITPNLELIWEKYESLPAYNNNTSHLTENFLVTPMNEIIIQGVVDTALEGTSTLPFFAKYDFEGNLLFYRAYFEYRNSTQGSELFFNEDSTAFYLFGSLSMPFYKQWAKFDLDFNLISTGLFENNQSNYAECPLAVKRLENGNFILANKIIKVGNTFPKGLEIRLYSSNFELLNNVLIYDDNAVAIPVHRGMGSIDEDHIWVASFEHIPPGIPGVTGMENISFYVFDANLNIKGTKVFHGDRRYWLFDLLATSDGGCLVSGVCDETPVSTYNDAYIQKVSLADVVTGSSEQMVIGHKVRLGPVPATDKLTVQTRSDDCDLLLYNLEGRMMAQHPLRNGVNLIGIQQLPSGLYIASVINNKNNTIENFKIIKQ